MKLVMLSMELFMRIRHPHIEIVRSTNSEKIAAEIIAIHLERQKDVCEYIETMASELSMIAAEYDEPFLGYLLKLAVAEAKTSKSYATA